MSENENIYQPFLCNIKQSNILQKKKKKKKKKGSGKNYGP